MDRATSMDKGGLSNATTSSRAGKLVRATLPSLVIAGGIGALGMVRKRFQHQQLFVPDRYPNGIWNPSSYGVPAEDTWFLSEDDTRLHGWWIPQPKARGVVLYCHGNAGNISSRIGVFRHLRRMGLHIFAFDYRGYGRSEGEPTEDGVCADARAAYDHLTSALGESPDRVLLFGHSLGGAVAIDCAGHRPVAGLVVQSTFTNVREMARARFPSLPLHWVARNQFRSIDKVAELEMPKLFIHGTGDETIPHALGRKLFEASSEPKEWYSVPHAGHNDVYRYGGFRYLWRLARFSRRCLKKKSTAA